MLVADSPSVATLEASANTKGPDFLTQLNQALVEVNAPIRSKGPGLLEIGSLVVKQILTPLSHGQPK
jgi:hypothetical protein